MVVKLQIVLSANPLSMRAIHEKSPKGKNIVLVALENRQTSIVEELRKFSEWDNMIQSVDDEGNNALHLAAMYGHTAIPWYVSSAAMQMHWYCLVSNIGTENLDSTLCLAYVKEIVSANLIFKDNNKGEISGENFIESHKELVREGSEWLRNTAESCSVMASLIEGVSFTTSGNISVGNNNNDMPNLEGKLSFDTFAMLSLVALCFSISVLIVFLSILTSRQQSKDYS
ncbi:uncharacterized protein [Arachis hypogaea]|uniref:PGG domain-containing protein n=1 Tax=Arachis hypogaea TaxID=3818 RepID=A0A445AEB1_ARAHY|nr:hypothetical protein Ahy_B02g058288 [Arachis hypogaea]